MRWQFSVNDIIRKQWNYISASGKFNAFKIKHLAAISKCRTPDLGGHIDACSDCGFYTYSYNSCGNRHCPTCGSLKRETWILKQEEKLLKVPYFHVVFTIPNQLNCLCLQHPRLIYGILFKTSWQTLQAFASDPKFLGAKSGMTAVLHTWGQNLSLHPHLHCIVPGGGLTKSGKWITTRSKGKYLYPKKALQKVFKGKFMAALKELTDSNTIVLSNKVRETCYHKKWVVYAKRPFAKPQDVIEYLGRYTHKTAISNYRLKAVSENLITFSYKDYKNGGIKKLMTLQPAEFVRRFALHILPHGFARMRHFGLLSSRGKTTYLPIIQRDMNIFPQKRNKEDLRQAALNRLKRNGNCPCCSNKKMVKICHFPRGEPPDETEVLRVVLKL